MKPKFGWIAAVALIMMLGSVTFFLSARSVAATSSQSGGISVTLGVGQQPGAPYTVSCESKSSRRTYCVADTRVGATVQQRFPGSAPCIFGNTWGADGEGIWVQGGCRATFIVNPYNGGPWWWEPGTGHRPPSQGIPSRGACFFKEKYYRGEYFCMTRGSSFNLVPPGFNDAISSIKVYGRVSIAIYKNSNFQGDNATFSSSVPDLAAWKLPSDRSRNWNNKISSVQVN
jgi:Protein of unknown function (DUF3011)/Beta/Gamma crystallin